MNVTREIDNFFPGIFNYFNVRVYDDEQTDLLKHWDNTFRYINRARNEKSKVLVHCKMGISRSASVVIAYAMKAYNWDFDQALRHVRDKRSCIKPNKNFLAQLETYQGMLDAMKNKEKLQRSKSETNLKSSTKDARLLPGSEPTPLIQAMIGAAKIRENSTNKKSASAGTRKIRKRPRSWSPEARKSPCTRSLTKPHSMSLEHLVDAQRTVACTLNWSNSSNSKSVLMPAGQASYCVSQNQIMCLQQSENSCVPSSVKTIVSELESSAISRHQHQTKDASPMWSAQTVATPPPPRDLVVEPSSAKSPRSTFIPIPPPMAEAALTSDEVVSRNSSWSSVDSAVVMGDLVAQVAQLSRNSSFGSGDPRPPSRNSSWGSYDIRNLARQQSETTENVQSDELEVGKWNLSKSDRLQGLF